MAKILWEGFESKFFKQNKHIIFISLMMIHNQRNNQPPNAPIQSQREVQLAQKEAYEVRSQMLVKFINTSTYRQMLNHEEYDAPIKGQLELMQWKKLDDPIFIFDGQIQPENVRWKIWKHPSEIVRFFSNMNHEIEMMNKYPKRIGRTGDQIMKLHHQLKNRTQWTVNEMPMLVQYLNLLMDHDFLRKSVTGLTFVEHCMPIDIWHLKVYQQVRIFEQKGFFGNLMNKQPEIKQYLTVTNDGILISTKNLLETKIDKMVPFTNQFQISTFIEDDDDFALNVSSCTHENLKLNFKEDYVGGVNFHLGVKDALIQSDYATPNRFQSFSRPRQNCWTKLYNDGEGYFSDLCDELNKARNQVCITDWWMTPYFLLKRPDDINHTLNRLDGVLKRCGERGVKVFIILFREPLDMLCNDSYDAQLYLQSLSRNIRLRRHPIVPQKWSHHQKCVIIDQRVAFMGGLDICYGRWDSPAHHITNVNNCWDGADYTNERIRGFAPGSTKNFEDGPIDRKTQPRMPWHDIGLQLRGDSVIDLAKHFVQYWYFVDAEKVKDPYNHLRNLQKRFDRASKYEEPDWEGEAGQEYDPSTKRHYTASQKVGLCGTRTKLFFTGTEKRLPQLLITAKPGAKKGDQQLQMCRSASPWSIGARSKQNSIHNAYQNLIRQSENFIYIENQFFMGEKNLIVSCLAERIERAHCNGDTFKVVVVMPLLPGFEGEIDAKTSGPLRIQVHNQFQSINRGAKSLHERLKHLQNFNINDYIYFFGLRNHGIIQGKPTTEIIYVHSKLMVVDDKRCIIGSANVNDRSLLGDRDSELAIVIEEDNGNVFGGQHREKGIFDLRQRIFNEHFGLSAEDSINILSPEVWSRVLGNAKKNTLIYRQLFGCYPDDTITVSDEIYERREQAKPELYDQLIPQIVGHAVQFPLDFMQDEDLEFQFGDKQSLAGPEMFL